MTRIEENSKLLEEMKTLSIANPSGTYKEAVSFQLGIIAGMLVDISKSLAVLADKVESEDRNETD